MRIVDGGLLTTVQDLGRYGYQKIGVSPGGAMDTFSMRMANILVGNPEDAAVLEITLKGPVVEFTSDALIALCGAHLSPEISDLELPHARAVAVRRGSELTFRRATSGCRVYLAVLGGIDVPVVMGSRSTHLRARIGGYDGRPLRADDEVAIGTPSPRGRNAMVEALSDEVPLPFTLSHRYVDEADRRLPSMGSRVRCVRGPHFDDLVDADQHGFFTDRYEVSTEADRMGYRLVGARLSSGRRGDLVSSAVTMGAVQLPSGGEPIVLMADRQTTGGYPVIAQVITADLGLVAQLKPGDAISFVEVDIATAQEALRESHRALAEIRRDIDDGASSRPQR